MISDEQLSQCIPDALKSDHPDSKLVIQAIVTAVAACENSDSVRVKSRMADIRAALEAVYVPVYQEHLRKEDEDWGELKAKADKYVPTVTLTVRRERPDFAQYTYSGDSSGTVAAFREDDGTWKAEAMSSGSSEPGQYGPNASDARGAVRALFESMGINAMFSGAAYLPDSPPISDQLNRR